MRPRAMATMSAGRGKMGAWRRSLSPGMRAGVWACAGAADAPAGAPPGVADCAFAAAISVVASAAGGAAPALSWVSTLNRRSPSLTLSPTATRTSLTRPPNGAGISMVALSLSRVSRDCSGWMRSPGATRISMISTPEKSPISGSRMSLALATFCPPSPCAADHTVTGCGFSASMRYFAMAAAGTAGGISPSSARALRAATAM